MEIYEKISRINNYLIDDGSEDKKAKGTKKCVISRKICLEATQPENKVNQLDKNKVNVDSLKIIKNS